MKKVLKIHLERLQEGKKEQFEESISPDVLQLSDDILTFTEPVSISGCAYASEDFLILQFNVHASVTLACSLCNEMMKLPINLHDVIEEISLDEIEGSVYDLAPLIREAILLEIPFYVQCGGDMCKNRKSVEKYLRQSDAVHPEQDTQQPFKDLN